MCKYFTKIEKRSKLTSKGTRSYQFLQHEEHLHAEGLPDILLGRPDTLSYHLLSGMSHGPFQQ